MITSLTFFYSHTKKSFLFFISLLLIGCGEGAITTNPPDTEYPNVKSRPLNDTGIIFSIDNRNLQLPVLTPRLDSEGNILSINNNFVNKKGQRYDVLKQAINNDGSPVFDSNNDPVLIPDILLDQNGQTFIEEISYVQKIRDEKLVFTATPDIYTSKPNNFIEQTNVYPTASLSAQFLGQDADYGSDSLITSLDADGKAGFQFTKLNKDNGSPLPSTDEEFGCVKDEITGLTWENKVDKRLSYLSPYHELHRSDARHTWYDPNSLTNGGDAGQSASQTLCTTVVNDTFNFAKDVNKEKLCGFEDWRIPTTEELRSIVDYSVKGGNSGDPVTDKNYFPFVASILHRWTNQTNTSNTDRAFGFHYFEGRMQAHNKYCVAGALTETGYHNGTLLVRGVY